MMGEAPAFGGFPGVFLVVLVVVAAAGAPPPGPFLAGVVAGAAAAVVAFCPKTPVRICKRSGAQ